MGLFSSKNIAKAKALAEKNKDKIAAGVNKATGVIDEKTGGKHTDKLKKVDDAAQKYAGTAASAAEEPAAGPDAAPDDSDRSSS